MASASKEVSSFAPTIGTCCPRARAGDLVYCDPPYLHTQSILYGGAEMRLSDLFAEIDRLKSQGVKVALSIDGRKKSGKEACPIDMPDGLFARAGGSSVVLRCSNGFSSWGRRRRVTTWRIACCSLTERWAGQPPCTPSGGTRLGVSTASIPPRDRQYPDAASHPEAASGFRGSGVGVRKRLYCRLSPASSASAPPPTRWTSGSNCRPARSSAGMPSTRA